MHWVLSVCSLVTFALFFPKMDIITPGDGVLARAPGTIVEFSDRSMTVQRVGSEREDVYQLISESEPAGTHDRDFAFWPRSESRQSWAGKDLGESERPFRIGDSIAMRELIARGTTHIYFQANMYVFTALVIVLGLAMGIGMAAVFKHIPTYFPEDVGLVGGLVGVIGGLGGFFFPIIFGWLLRGTGIWTTCWVFLFLFSLGCLVWMRVVLRRMMQQHAPDLLEHFERHEGLTLRSTSVPGK
jgi:NNP family nitrate/nitrite transporter-like MFS transporter